MTRAAAVRLVGRADLFASTGELAIDMSFDEEMAREILERGVYDRMLRGALDTSSVNGLFPEPLKAGSRP
jgi:hypothetical protein